MARRGNGEGTIYYSKKTNKWVGQFVAGRKTDGSINRKSVYGNTRKEVKEKMTKKLADIQDKTFIDTDNTILIDLIKSYCEKQFEANKFTEATYLRKKETINIISKLPIADMKIQKIKIVDINNSLSKITSYSDSVIQKVTGLLSTIYDYAVILNIVNSNPFKIRNAIIRPKSAKQTKEIEALSIEEQKSFLEQLQKSNDKYKDIFYIAIFSGMRIGEILALKGSDINIGNKTISIGRTLTKNLEGKVILGEKTKTYAGKREIPFLEVLTPMLSNFTNKDFIFLNGGNFINPSTINTHFKKICRDAEIKVYDDKKMSRGKVYKFQNSNVNTHMLRHTFATRCIESGMSAVVLSKILGHKDIETTLNTYTSVFNKFKENELEKAEKYLVALKLH